jgi:hypothetical protein
MNEPSVSTIDFLGGEIHRNPQNFDPKRSVLGYGTFGFAPEDDSVVRLAFFRPWEKPMVSGVSFYTNPYLMFVGLLLGTIWL